MSLFSRCRELIDAFWLAITGITISQLNAYLGAISLLIGMSYQIWKWHKEAKTK
jgi:hypothetical protein